MALEEPDLKGYLMRHRGAAGLSLQWVLFGSSGHRDRPAGGPLRHFNKCSNQLSYQMKCMASSHHLHEHPFIAPLVLHSCCYKCVSVSFSCSDNKTSPGSISSLFLRVFSV